MPKGFLFPCSSAFLLSISAFILSVLLIYFILKQYLDNISAYLTCFWFNSFIIRNPVKFLQSILIINGSAIPCKNTFYSFSAITIASNSLLQILQFNSSGIIFQLQYATRCHTLSLYFYSKYTPTTKSNASVLTLISSFTWQIFSISSFINSSLISANSSFCSVPYFYSLLFFIILVNSSIFCSNYRIPKIILDLLYSLDLAN